MIGTVLKGYRIAEKIKDGGTGSVYRAVNSADQSFAIKMLHSQLCGISRKVKAFKREGTVTRSLDHPGIIQCIEHVSAQRPYIIMEYFESENLIGAIGTPLCWDMCNTPSLSSYGGPRGASGKTTVEYPSLRYSTISSAASRPPCPVEPSTTFSPVWMSAAIARNGIGRSSKLSISATGNVKDVSNRPIFWPWTRPGGNLILPPEYPGFRP